MVDLVAFSFVCSHPNRILQRQYLESINCEFHSKMGFVHPSTYIICSQRDLHIGIRETNLIFKEFCSKFHFIQFTNVLCLPEHALAKNREQQYLLVFLLCEQCAKSALRQIRFMILHQKCHSHLLERGLFNRITVVYELIHVSYFYLIYASFVELSPATVFAVIISENVYLLSYGLISTNIGQPVGLGFVF